MSEELWHYGTLHRSGRYPWGSGDDPHQRNRQFLQYVDDLKKKGMSDVEIAKGMGLNTTELRQNKSIAKNAIKKAEISEAIKLKEKGLSTTAIGEKMGKNESSVRALLDDQAQVRNKQLGATAQLLKDQVGADGYLDIGRGTGNLIGVSSTGLATAVAKLQEEGYGVHYVKVKQLGTGKQTTIKVLAPPNTPYREIFNNQDKIKTISGYSEDNGSTFEKIEPPKGISSKRVGVRWAEDGGAQKDGVIELRRDVGDLSLGAARYAQVRVLVDDKHYLKGMAMYSDHLPDGVDMMFNTNKPKSDNKFDAMKPTEKNLKNDPENPFGSITRQKHYIDSDGKRKLSPLNIVGSENPEGDSTSGEEGGWSKWSHTLSSQMLSKQSPALAKQQLKLTYDVKRAEFDEINSLTNPAVKKKLLESFADGADASAVNLKAAGLPRTRAHVILPINSLKDDEIYAPNYRNGEKVVLIRHPHGGTFEIPELTVNNRNREANSVIKNALDAVGINSKVAERLSGADFDGDTVLVIPNNSRKVKTTSPLKDLKDFDPKTQYPKYEGMKVMGEKGGGNKQTEMGNISNLITDMTIQGAPHSEIARAVKHSMVVIDAEKHELNYKQSAIDNGIKELKKKYQGEGLRSNAGASTLISRASSDVRIDDRKPRSAANGGPIDRATGRKMYEPAGNSYVDKNGKTITPKIKSKKLAETDDAFSLMSKPGTPIEAVYANHANQLKALANEARKAQVRTPSVTYSPSANKVYAPQVQSLNAKLNEALRNAPLERQAQLLANATVHAKQQANPAMDKDQLKKVKGQALTTSRIRTGAKKQQIDITADEWAAIQAGAISNSKLNQILNNTDLDRVKALATPRTRTVMVPAKLARAKAMQSAGYTQADIADALGVPVSTLNDALA